MIIWGCSTGQLVVVELEALPGSGHVVSVAVEGDIKPGGEACVEAFGQWYFSAADEEKYLFSFFWVLEKHVLLSDWFGIPFIVVIQNKGIV